MDELIKNSRELRAKFLEDPYRPAYHFTVPEGLARPFDPNGCIFWKGRYHLFYIFQDPSLPHRGHCWGHVSSIDLVHWTHHPPALVPQPKDPDKGIFSGNAFVNIKGEATILYHGVGVGNCIATSSDDDLVHWVKSPANPIVPIPKEGDPDFGKYESWDPHGWLEGDTYYAIFGGRTVTLFRSKDLTHWEYVHPFIQSDRNWVDPDEDCSCPDFFPLGKKYMLLCISHKRGCRYYLGRYENETFYPESHARMSWQDNAFFAPESLLDDKGRRIMWAWIFDGRNKKTQKQSGWSGTMSLPRVLWLGEDDTLRIRPPEELKMLRFNPKKLEGFTVEAYSEIPLKEIKGNCLELKIVMVPNDAEQFGVRICCSPEGEEQTVIFYDAAENKLKIDTTKSSLDEGSKSVEGGPFKLKPCEPLHLRIFLDKSVIEVFANHRQAVMRRIYPTRKDSRGVVLFSSSGSTKVRSLEAWDMAPANPY